jgi:hypothetical protein
MAEEARQCWFQSLLIQDDAGTAAHAKDIATLHEVREAHRRL